MVWEPHVEEQNLLLPILSCATLTKSLYPESVSFFVGGGQK